MATFYSTNPKDSVKNTPAEFDSLAKKALESIKQITELKMSQVVILQTADNKMVEGFIIVPSEVDEQKILNEIGANDTVVRLVCCWHDGSFDLPSSEFRKRLCEINPQNEAAQILLSGDKQYILKSIRDTFSKCK